MLCEECEERYKCRGVCEDAEFVDEFELAGYLEVEMEPIPLDVRFV